MKKKSVSILIAMAIVLGIVGCGNTVSTLNEGVPEENTEEVAAMAESDSKEAVAAPDSAQVPVSTQASAPTQRPTPEPAAEPTPHVHSYTEMVTAQAACAVEGEKKLTCECGDVKFEKIPATGNHNWLAQTTVVHHDSLGHTEEIQVQVGMTEGRTEYACSVCGARFDTPSGVVDHCYATTLNNPDVALVSPVVGFDEAGNPLYRNVVGIDDDGNYITEISTERKKWGTDSHWMARTIAYDYPGEPIYEIQSQWIVDQEAWDETVVTGYICSVCGATK